MKERDQTPTESATHAAASVGHAHPWIDALADSFVIEIEQTESNDADTQASDAPRYCTLQLNAWWTRLI